MVKKNEDGKNKEMKLLITIDTECDNAWARSKSVTTKNARYLPRFQELCESFGCKPTYLVAYEMAVDDFFREFATDILRRGTGEIGAHLHPWNSPPSYDLTSDDMKYHPYLIEYPENIMRQKLKFLRCLLEDTFSTKVNSHRAGRWPINPTYARMLADFDYKVDCSVTPYIVWRSEWRPPGDPPCPVIDYSSFPEKPYFLCSDDISKAGDLSILEIPVTVIPRYGHLLKKMYSMVPQGIMRRGMHFLFGRPVMWFRPHPAFLNDLMIVAKRCLDLKLDYIMFMLHSSELMPGGSPNFRRKSDVDRMYDKIEKAFEFLADNKTTGYTCYEYYKYHLSKVIGNS